MTAASYDLKPICFVVGSQKEALVFSWTIWFHWPYSKLQPSLHSKFNLTMYYLYRNRLRIGFFVDQRNTVLTIHLQYIYFFLEWCMPNATQAWCGCQLPDSSCLDKVIEGHFFKLAILLVSFYKSYTFYTHMEVKLQIEKCKVSNMKVSRTFKECKAFCYNANQAMPWRHCRKCIIFGGSEILISHCLLLQSAWCDSH